MANDQIVNPRTCAQHNIDAAATPKHPQPGELPVTARAGLPMSGAGTKDSLCAHCANADHPFESAAGQGIGESTAHTLLCPETVQGAVIDGDSPTAGKPAPTFTRPTRLYLSGPMRGIAELNFPAFHRAADRLRDEGYEVINPAELSLTLSPDLSAPLGDYFRQDVMAMGLCDAVALLPNWDLSQGARAEVEIAGIISRFQPGYRWQPVEAWIDEAIGRRGV